MYKCIEKEILYTLDFMQAFPFLTGLVTSASASNKMTMLKLDQDKFSVKWAVHASFDPKQTVVHMNGTDAIVLGTKDDGTKSILLKVNSDGSILWA